jgi:hypothetical protein
MLPPLPEVLDRTAEGLHVPFVCFQADAAILDDQCRGVVIEYLCCYNADIELALARAKIPHRAHITAVATPIVKEAIEWLRRRSRGFGVRRIELLSVTPPEAD